MPSRKIPRSYTSIRGNLYSYTLHRMIGFESRLEKDAFMYLDWVGTAFNKTIINKFEEQPGPVIWNGKKYTPDVLISFDKLKKKPWLCEIKYSSKLKSNWHYWRVRFKQAIRYARDNNMIFKILTEREIQIPNMDLLWFLRTHSRSRVDALKRKSVVSALKDYQRVSPRALAQSLGRNDEDRRVFEREIWRMAAVGEIYCDVWFPRDQTFVCLEFPRLLKVFSKKWLFNLGHNDLSRQEQRPFKSECMPDRRRHW